MKTLRAIRKVKTECPRCGHKYSIEVETRAALGEGTIRCRGLKSFNKNHMNLMKLIYEQAEKEKFSVRMVSRLLYPVFGQPPIFRRWISGDRKTPSAGWNYHDIQASLSCIVGADMMCMVKMIDEYWSDDLQKYVAKPVPFYFMDKIQRIRWETVRDTADASGYIKRPAIERNPEGW